MMSFSETLTVLRPLATKHATARGERVGFFMRDATLALGGLDKASNALMVLMAEGLVDSEPVMVGDDVHTLYSITGAVPPAVH